MIISELTIYNIAEHLHENPDEITGETRTLLSAMQDAAVSYVKAYTGLSDEPLDESEDDWKKLDAHEDLTIAVLMLISDMYDNRSMTVDQSHPNMTVQTILNMHCINL